jgi:glycosyltransferase involved in cell wall biosynthesis
MKERIWLSNYDLDDIRGGAEILGNQFCRAMKLKYISAKKLGVSDSESMDKKLIHMPIELIVYNSTNCWSRKPKADLSIAVCCENFGVEALCLNDDRFNEMKTNEWNRQQKSLKNADKIITLSKQEKIYFEHDGFNTKIIEPYIDLDSFYPKSVERENKLMALFVGRAHPRKGFDIVTELADRFPNIIFANVVDGTLLIEDLNDLYNQADFLLMPSRYESFGFIFAEALATNLPIISSRVGLFGQWQPEEFGIFPKEITVDAFAEAIKSFDRSEFDKSRELAELRFNYERFKGECNDLLSNG